MTTSARDQRLRLALHGLWSGVAAAGLLALLALPARAMPLLRDYQHQAWGAADGVPPQVQYLAQTGDGYLWLSSDHGLYRFDGTYFEAITSIGGQALLSTHVLTLLAPADGGLWVAYRDGGASFFKDGAVQHYGAREGLPVSPPSSMAQGPDGRIWSATGEGLYQLRAGRWLREGVQQGVLSRRGEVDEVAFARDGTQWISTGMGIFQRRPGAARFALLPPGTLEQGFFAGAAGRAIIGGDAGHLVYRLARRGQRGSAAQDAPNLWLERSGAMWLARAASLARLAPGPLPARRNDAASLAIVTGLSGPQPQCFLEDRSGNIWIGTQRGLDRFRPYHARAVPISSGVVSPALARGRNGSVWVSENNRWARRYTADGKQLAQEPYAFAASVTTADGLVRLGSQRGIWFEDGGAGHLLPVPPEVQAAGRDVSSIGLDDSGHWWAGLRGFYAARYVDGAWRRADTLLPIGTVRPFSMLGDSRGRLWMAFKHNRLLRYSGGVATLFGAADGLAMGDVSLVYERAGDVWVGGSNGLALFDGSRFRMLTALDGHPLGAVSGMVVTTRGELWVRAYGGVFRLQADALKAYLHGGAAPSYRLFDAGDGVPAPNGPIGPFPSLIEASDERLWITGNDGVATLLPAQLASNMQPPHVRIRTVGSNGSNYVPAPHMLLPEDSNNVRFSFSALNLSRPERTRFRYRLAGVDGAWQEADARREAVYTGLDAGSYRFEVSAVNEDGVASLALATLTVVLVPTFLHSLGFRLLCGAVALTLLAALVYIVRLRHAMGVIEARHVERMGERKRIARALHDTLLQESQGAILLLQRAMHKIDRAHPARADIGRIVGFMEEALAEGRDEVMGLRSGMHTDVPLHDALERFGRRMADNLAAGFSLQVTGTPYRVDVTLAGEIYAVVREAVVNAFRHAAGTQVSVSIDYAATALTVKVSDDGVGIPERVDTLQGKPGHYGLTGMRGRAGRIGAELLIAAAAGGGTEVTLRVPQSGAVIVPAG